MVKYIRIYIRTKYSLQHIIYTMFTVYRLSFILYLSYTFYITGARLIDNTSVQIYMCVQKYLLAKEKKRKINSNP